MIAKWEVAVVDYPFTDGSGKKLRPTLVLTDPIQNDVILCQVTTKKPQDNYAVTLTSADMEYGPIKYPSWIRINKIFTLETKFIEFSIGKINQSKQHEVSSVLAKLFKNT
ncbi:type II toxin-antitoxin system PemK/MazF family toxin [Methanolobus halotolerans]|nr:type II toxin-antitoxin system PemK/MazF family toxin [Methanolobus halotolerans]